MHDGLAPEHPVYLGLSCPACRRQQRQCRQLGALLPLHRPQWTLVGGLPSPHLDTPALPAAPSSHWPVKRGQEQPHQPADRALLSGHGVENAGWVLRWGLGAACWGRGGRPRDCKGCKARGSAHALRGLKTGRRDILCSALALAQSAAAPVRCSEATAAQTSPAAPPRSPAPGRRQDALHQPLPHQRRLVPGGPAGIRVSSILFFFARGVGLGVGGWAALDDCTWTMTCRGACRRRGRG